MPACAPRPAPTSRATSPSGYAAPRPGCRPAGDTLLESEIVVLTSVEDRFAEDEDKPVFQEPFW